MYFESLMQYKNLLMRDFTNNKKLMELLYAGDDMPEDVEDIAYDRIYPFGLDPEIETNRHKVLLMFDIDSKGVTYGNNVTKYLGVYVWIFCHVSNMKQPEGTRLDLMVNEVDRMINKNPAYSFMELQGLTRIQAAKKEFAGVQLYYQANKVLNSSAPFAKEYNKRRVEEIYK